VISGCFVRLKLGSIQYPKARFRLSSASGHPALKRFLLNPYNEREFLDDKLSIVDVKARDALGRLYQIEIQIEPHPDLLARLVYTWADLYSQQLQSGQDYGALRPTYAIWLLSKDLLKGDRAYAHRYWLRDDFGQLPFEHGGIALFELSKFAAAAVENEEQRWLKFFKEGERLDADRLPNWMQTHEMRQAMSTLKRFADKERAYDAYQARQNDLRVQGSIARRQQELEAALAQERAAREAVFRWNGRAGPERTVRSPAVRDQLQGLSSLTPVRMKSSVFRVTRIRSRFMATAAISVSICGSGAPALSADPIIRPQRCRSSSSSGRMRSRKRGTKLDRSQTSNAR
jgi:predicted transposase/invertase (TIGR01784 family)